MLLFGVAASSTDPAEQTPLAPEVTARFRAVQDSVGGHERLAAVKTLIIVAERRARNQFYGQVNSPAAAEYMTAPREVRVLLPDHYSWVQAASPSFPVRRQGGFAASEVIGRQSLDVLRQEFGVLVFALTLRTDTVFPLRLRGLSGHTLEFADPQGDTVRLDIDEATGWPARIRYQRRLSTDRPPLTTTIALGDYRPVGDLQFPHALTSYWVQPELRTVHDESKAAEELRIESLRINPPLTKADFRAAGAAILAVRGR
jgi:hypothetical protein